MEIGGVGNALSSTKLNSDPAKAGTTEGESLNATVQQTGGSSREAETSPIPPANPAGEAPSDQNNITSQGGGAGSGSIISVTA